MSDNLQPTPCPVCGMPPVIRYAPRWPRVQAGKYRRITGYMAVCATPQCPGGINKAPVWDLSPELAVKRWNKRTEKGGS